MKSYHIFFRKETRRFSSQPQFFTGLFRLIRDSFYSKGLFRMVLGGTHQFDFDQFVFPVDSFDFPYRNAKNIFYDDISFCVRWNGIFETAPKIEEGNESETPEKDQFIYCGKNCFANFQGKKGGRDEGKRKKGKKKRKIRRKK